MAVLRYLPLAHRRWLLLLAVVALVARALIPAGWMPVASAQGVTLALCGGDAAMAHATAPMTAMPMKSGAPMEHHQGAPDHPCSFAAAGAALTTPGLIAPTLPPFVPHQPPLARATVAIGQGLAAPPPPPTGPPTFA